LLRGCEGGADHIYLAERERFDILFGRGIRSPLK